MRSECSPFVPFVREVHSSHAGSYPDNAMNSPTIAP